MKTTLTLTVSILFFTLLVLGLVLPTFNQPNVSAQGALPLQITPTPQADDTSVIGSTDGILAMGIVIVLIVTLPLLFHKKQL